MGSLPAGQAAPAQRNLPVGMTAVPVAAAATVPVAAVAVTPRRRRVGTSPWIKALVALPFLIALGVGGWYGYRWWQDNEDGTLRTLAPSTTTTAPGDQAAAGFVTGERFRVAPGVAATQAGDDGVELACVPLTVTNEGGTVGGFPIDALSMVRPSGAVALRVETIGGNPVAGALAGAVDPGATADGSACWQSAAEQGRYTMIYDPQNELAASWVFTIGTATGDALPEGR